MSIPARDYDVGELESALAGSLFSHKLHYIPETGSTNTVAMHAGAAGVEEGHVFFTDQQTAGRGRGGHSWQSESGTSILASILLRPRIQAAQALWLSLMAGVAVHDSILNNCGIDCDLRWPNDLLLDGRKVAGILVQVVNGDAIAGIGINVNHAAFPPDLEATSLRLHAKRSYAREDILDALIAAVDAMVGADAETILRRFSEGSSYAAGRRVTVDQPGGAVAGMTAGLNRDGYLIVRRDDGTDTVILAGGVRAAGS